MSKTLPQLYPLRNLLEDVVADAEDAYDARQNERARGPVTGLEGVDAALGGCFTPGVTVITGNTGVGKTAFGLQTAVDSGAACLYLSAEMRPVELFRRIMARVTSTYLGRLKGGELSPELFRRLAEQTIEVAPALAIADATTAPTLPEWILDAAEKTRAESRYLLVVIDSVHSWVEGWAEGDEYTSINLGLAALRKLATQLNCSVLAIAEQNRAAMRSGKAGDVNAAAGSRKFEFGAEAVLDLNRKKDADEDLNGDVEITLTLAKNRNGSAGRPVQLLFNGALQQFR